VCVIVLLACQQKLIWYAPVRQGGVRIPIKYCSSKASIWSLTRLEFMYAYPAKVNYLCNIQKFQVALRRQLGHVFVFV
jgi:hypothetical protein